MRKEALSFHFAYFTRQSSSKLLSECNFFCLQQTIYDTRTVYTHDYVSCQNVRQRHKTNALSFQEYKPCICLNKQAFHNFVWQVCFKQSEVELESNIFKPSLTRVFSCVWDPLYVLVWPSGDFFYYYYYFLCVCVCAIFFSFTGNSG